MILDWFNAREAVIFAEKLALEIDRLYPVEVQQERPRSKKKDLKKLDEIVFRTRTFSNENPLNTYKKAKFLNTIKWNLKEAGQDEKLINEIIVLLTVALAH